MSTTHIQPLPNVYGRMAYTELGEGKKRTENIQNGTNRIAAQMGDGDSREEFVRFCSAMKRQNQGRENEGFEVRVSWAPEELSKDDPEDIQRACEYGYLLCKEVAPNAPCWVTVHTDGEGGCVHVHATIANHDLETGNAIAHGTDHATVKRKNDQLSRQMGFSVVGPSRARRGRDGRTVRASSSRALSSACWETASRKPATRRPAWTSSARSLGCAAWS